MSIFKKMLLIPAVIAVPLVTTTLTSCATINDLDTNLANQLELLTSDAAKEVYKNTWSRDAFAELYLRKNSKDGLVNANEKTAIKQFLEKFDKTSISTSITTIAGKPIATVFEEIQKSLFSAFEFYTSWKSSTDPVYFINQKSTWVEKNLGLMDSTDKWISINTFDAKFLYSSFIVDDIEKFKNDFNFLYKIIQTGIQTELLNMMISEFYFTSSTSNIVEIGTNYNEIINGNINGLSYWDATSFNINSPTYFLEKYLITKSPKIKWNYASDNKDQIDEWTNRPIKSIADYSDLWFGYEEGSSASFDPIFSPDLIVRSNDNTFNEKIQNIYGYNSAIELSGTSIGGDLSTNGDDIRRYTYTKSGLLNSNSNINQLVSFDNLKNMEAIEKIKTSVADPSPFLIPISIKNTSITTRKKSHQITLEDLVISNGNGGELTTDGSYTEGSNTWKVNEILPILGSSNSQQSITLNMSYDHASSSPEKTVKNYTYDVIITWSQNPSPALAEIVSELNKPFYFNQNELNTPFGKRNSYGVNAIVEGKVSVSYYMRILPNFIWEKETSGAKRIKIIDGKEKALGKFSMDGTPWTKENPENLRKLIFTLYMNDAELLKDIQKVFVLNDIALLPGGVKEVNDILNELGILYIKNKPDYAKPKPKTI